MLPLLTKFRGELYQRGIKYTGMGKNAIFDRKVVYLRNCNHG